ncbi:hypothetical protein Spea_0619 [Shewanella pealeana ATCC 700345]|uniref:Uncharacterized protein n=1 Tax=Shewanella pealeana (strain ATCC 700345 / ANG-SQ1) TaxID=398579 RepID=A8H060_SHEPA|nr:hypothetical protein Spea_0619 [Shewanella pealeana ATCC 700345]
MFKLKKTTSFEVVFYFVHAEIIILKALIALHEQALLAHCCEYGFISIKPYCRPQRRKRLDAASHPASNSARGFLSRAWV